MKKGMILICALFCVNAFAQENTSNDFSRSENEIKAMTPEEQGWRFHLTGEVFVMNKDGDKLINVANESREWSFGGSIEKPLESNWRFQQKGLPLVALKHKWQLEKDGKISVEIAQYEDFERVQGSEVKYGKLIKEEKIVLKNFAPIDWEIPGSGAQKVIVRLTPGIWQNEEAVNISTLPISNKNIVIYDRAGKLWAESVTADRTPTYLGIVTHEGSLALSFSPFKGAALIGEAKGNRIKIKSGKATVFLQGEQPFVPRNVKANVYGMIRLDRKTERLNSVRTYSSDKEAEFLKSMNGN